MPTRKELLLELEEQRRSNRNGLVIQDLLLFIIGLGNNTAEVWIAVSVFSMASRVAHYTKDHLDLLSAIAMPLEEEEEE